jgi:uncharacterized protein YabE (DUF348 family)
MGFSKRSLGQRWLILVAVSCSAVVLGTLFVQQVNARSAEVESGERLITVHDEDTERGILTHAGTLRDAFHEAGIPIDASDLVEPGLDEKLEANNYQVNIYRARPVTIIDGKTSIRIMSPYRTPVQIAQQAGIVLHDQDSSKLAVNTDIVSQGAGVQLSITRATEFTLMLYGKKTTAYTQGKTVAAMLKEKDIKLGADDTLSSGLDVSIQPGMTVEIWRNGVQTATEEQEIPFDTQKILDMDHSIGYHEIKTEGKAGTRLITYEVVRENGKEISRKEIQNVIGKQPVRQVELVGNRPSNPLTKSKGAAVFVDSQGVSHRETYYDLPMNVVIGACGGGTYGIREDGAKVDQNGYILIAANYGRYPRCSIVETSMGLGKVYDTGGFAKVHPDGFDLGTDWTNYDGR